jgi:hypothetical protein
MNSRLSIINLEESQNLGNKKGDVYINFLYTYSIKVYPFYESICKKDREFD